MQTLFSLLQLQQQIPHWQRTFEKQSAFYHRGVGGFFSLLVIQI
jgi:hypothetical protein